MDRVAIKTHAKERIQGKIFILFAVSLIIALLSALGTIPFIGALIILLITGPLMFAESKIYLNVVDKNRAPKIEDVFEGFKGENLTRSIVGYIRYNVFTFLWSLLFFIPGIVKNISYSQMFYLMVENKKLEAAEAQKKSMEIMEGHRWEYFMLQLSFIPWGILVCITFGIAGIYVMPYMAAAKAEFYRKLKK